MGRGENEKLSFLEREMARPLLIEYGHASELPFVVEQRWGDQVVVMGYTNIPYMWWNRFCYNRGPEIWSRTVCFVAVDRADGTETVVGWGSK